MPKLVQWFLRIAICRLFRGSIILFFEFRSCKFDPCTFFFSTVYVFLSWIGYFVLESQICQTLNSVLQHLCVSCSSYLYLNFMSPHIQKMQPGTVDLVFQFGLVYLSKSIVKGDLGHVEVPSYVLLIMCVFVLVVEDSDSMASKMESDSPTNTPPSP